MCDECRENNRKSQYERRTEYKNYHICVICGSQEAMQGRTRCIGCAEKDREYNRMRKKDYDSQKYMHDRYQRLKDNGICVYCGKRQALSGSRCSVCNAKEKKRAIKRNREKGICSKQTFDYMGLCVICGKPRYKGKVCETHYSNCLNMSKLAKERLLITR